MRPEDPAALHTGMHQPQEGIDCGLKLELARDLQFAPHYSQKPVAEERALHGDTARPERPAGRCRRSPAHR